MRHWLYHSKAQAEIPPEHDECPAVCAAGLDQPDSCDGCPVKEARADFEEALAEDLRERLGDRWDKYSIPSLISTIGNVSDLEDTDRSGWSILTDLLVKILKSERGRLRRIDDWNKRVQK